MLLSCDSELRMPSCAHALLQPLPPSQHGWLQPVLLFQLRDRCQGVQRA